MPAHDRLQRGISADHENRAVGQIDDVQDTEDQSKSESEQCVNAAEGDRIDDLLGEHSLFLNDVLVALGHHHDGSLHGIVTGGLAVAAGDLAKLEWTGGAGELSRG